jgi:hypothetical protein
VADYSTAAYTGDPQRRGVPVREHAKLVKLGEIAQFSDMATPTVTKTEFATIAGVKPPAVSNWIRRGKLKAPALLPDGSINVKLAKQQLGLTLNGLMHAGAMRRNGFHHRAAEPGNPVNDANMQLLEARATEALIKAERSRRELEAERGRFMVAEDAEAAWSKVMAEFLADVEQGFGDLAYQLAGLDERERLLVIRKWWRAIRGRSAAANKLAAEAEPEFVQEQTAG